MRWQGKALHAESTGQAQLPMLLILPAALMQFMGDQAKPRDKDDMDLLYELLKVSKSHVCWELRGDAVSPAHVSLSCLGLKGIPLPLVTMHSNHPKVLTEHLL